MLAPLLILTFAASLTAAFPLLAVAPALANGLAIFGFVCLLVYILSRLGLTGPFNSGDGNPGPPTPRNAKTGEAVLTQAHGKYYEGVSRGGCFGAQTAATGVAPGTALGTTAAYCLHNPAGSGKRLVIQKISMGLISGTIGAGTVHICSSTSGDAVPTGTAIVPRNLDVGSATASVALPFTTATITTNAAKQIGIVCALEKNVVNTDVLAAFVIEKDVDGEIVIEPGFNINFCGTTATGSSPLVVFNVTWEEVTIV